MIGMLTKIVGEKNITARGIDKLVYASDASQIEGETVAVLWPQAPEQIQKVIECAIKNKLNLVPRGAGTGLAGAAVPKRSIILDFSKMNRVLKLNIEEKYAIVEPGIVLNDLNAYLKQFNSLFPVLPASYKVCTIGGMISTNAAGERALKFGKTSDWVLELGIVNGKGEAVSLKTKGEVEEVCGAEGCLAVITKAKLKLTKPLGRRSITLLKFDKIPDMLSAVKSYRAEKDVIAIEFFDKLAAKLSGLDEKHHLFIEFESERGKIKEEDEITRIWNLREGMGPVLSSEGFLIMEDPKIPLTSIDKFLHWLSQNRIPSFGHIGIGIIHPRFKEGQKHLINKMFGLVKSLNGEVSGEHGIGITKKEFAKKEFINKMLELKKRYDPADILNRGKLV